MDYLNFVLESLDYSLYSEEVVFESIDVKRFGGNISTYIKNFFDFISKKIREVFEKVKTFINGTKEDNLIKEDELYTNKKKRKEQEKRESENKKKREEMESREKSEREKKDREAKARYDKVMKDADDAIREAEEVMAKREERNKAREENSKKLDAEYKALLEEIKPLRKTSLGDNAKVLDKVYDFKLKISNLYVNEKFNYKDLYELLRTCDALVNEVLEEKKEIMKNNEVTIKLADFDFVYSIVAKCSDIILGFENESIKYPDKTNENYSKVNDEIDSEIKKQIPVVSIKINTSENSVENQINRTRDRIIKVIQSDMNATTRYLSLLEKRKNEKDDNSKDIDTEYTIIQKTLTLYNKVYRYAMNVATKHEKIEAQK